MRDLIVREARSTMRRALQGASREKVEEILEAARAGRVPWAGRGRPDDPYGRSIEERTKICGCLGQRLYMWTQAGSGLDVSTAYLQCAISDGPRQRVLVSMCKAELRRRDDGRELTRQLREDQTEPNEGPRISEGHAVRLGVVADPHHRGTGEVQGLAGQGPRQLGVAPYAMTERRVHTQP